MRILEINKYLYQKGGAETYLLALIELLKKNGQKIICFSQKNPANIESAGEEFFISDLDLSGADRSAAWRWGRIFWSFAARRAIKKTIRKYRPDIAHIHNIYHQISPSILPILKSAGIPIVMTVHDFKLITPFYTLRADGAEMEKSLPARLLLRAEFAWHKKLRIYERNVDLFLAPSEFVKNKLIEEGYPPEKIAVLPLFVPSRFFSSKAPEAEDKYILSFGRLNESKGFDDLIAAFSELKVRGLKLKIAGDGPDRARLQKLIKSMRLDWQIELLGRKSPDDIKRLIEGAEIVVNCSKVHETFGLAVLEAMAIGRPIIASKVGAIPELIRHGESGLLYDAADAGDLKRQLHLLLGNGRLRSRLATAARSAAESYRPEKHLKRIMGTFDRAILDHKPPIKRIHTNWVRLIFLLALASLMLTPFYYQKPQPSEALTGKETFPKLANLYWKNPITTDEAAKLAKWDLLVLDMQAQESSPEAIREIRRRNPKIIILAYTTATEMPTTRLSAVEPSGEGLWHKLAKIDDPAWHLRTYQGKEIVFWPGNVMMNLGLANSSGLSYGDALVDFYSNEVLPSGLWDGLLFDNAWATAAWVDKKIDIDGDGKADSDTKINSYWKLSYDDFFLKLRRRVGKSFILIGNGDGIFRQSLNGRMLEGFPEYWEGGWSGSMQHYQDASSTPWPNINIVNSDTDNTGNSTDYRKMRFGLTSTLMLDGYFSFDYGTDLREQLWWYDEYSADLGRPTTSATNLLSADNSIGAGVWQREFENGLALVNSTDQPQTVTLPSRYQKIYGRQDPVINNGETINEVTIPAQDGIILLKPKENGVVGEYIRSGLRAVDKLISETFKQK